MTALVQVTATATGFEKVEHLARKLTGPQMADAQAKALTDVAFTVRGAMVKELTSQFDRPTHHITSAPKVIPAQPGDLKAKILPTKDTRNIWSKGGKEGMSPQYILQAQEFGGTRADKRSEVALRRAGILPRGYQTALPATPYPGSDDGRGNIRGAFASQLISYLQASSEQGYRANMSDRRKQAMRNQQGIGSIATKRVYKTTLGVRFFVAFGGMRRGRTRHLAPGIWAAKGTHDVDVQPVLMFVRRPAYKARISMDRVAASIGTPERLATRMRFRIRQAAGV